MLLTLIVFLIILSVLVLIHEAGHFFVAKKFGIKVEEFGFGFPPRVWGIKKGETIYSINALPIGGFVKLYGEDEAGAGRITVKQQGAHAKGDADRAFFAKPLWQRALVIVAGVIMNTVLAAVIFYIFLGLSGFKTELPVLDNYHTFFGVNTTYKSDLIISDVAKGSPAAQAHMSSGVRITAINGQPVKDSKTFIQIIDAQKGKQVMLTWQNVETDKTTTAPVEARVNPPKGQGALGVQFFAMDAVTLSYDTPAQKILSGFIHPANLMVYTLVELKNLVVQAIQTKNIQPISQNVSGPVGIYSLVGTIVHIPNAKERVIEILNLAGLLSISLAFFNVLPIPGLDGGRFFFILIESVTRKKINATVEGWINTVGMIFLIALIILVTIKDINQYIFQFFK